MSHGCFCRHSTWFVRGLRSGDEGPMCPSMGEYLKYFKSCVFYFGFNENLKVLFCFLRSFKFIDCIVANAFGSILFGLMTCFVSS